MSFNVNWSSLETDSLREWTTELLTGALNSGKRPNVLASDITIKDLNFGKIAPEFEILEIGELAKDRFRGIFKINYSGDFHLTLHTQVQANPLKIYSDSSREKEINKESSFVTPDFLLSTEPFNIPLDLKLSDIKISGIGIIVFSKTKGLTLVFRNDPLDSIKVSSTFDTVKVLSNFLQTQIENQIRDLFREKLPTLIHKFSLKYTSSFKNNDIMNNFKDHLKDQNSQSAFDSLELETVAPSNLKKLAQLYSSRETLELDIPKIRKTIQRNYLEKFNKDYYPSLANSLYSSLNLPRVQGSLPENNSIPVELLVDSDFKQVDQILKEISTIQTRSNNSNNTDVKRAKRRTIKMSRRMKKAPLEAKQNIEVPVQVSTNAQTTHLGDNCEKLKEKAILAGDNESGDALSDTSTIREDPESIIHHPTPMKAKIARPFLHRNLEQKGDLFTSANRHVCSSPLSSNSSFVGGVGLGSTVYTIVPGSAIRGSPLRTESMNISQKAKTDKVKKSMNTVDIRHINEKLNMMLNFEDSRETLKNKEVFSTKRSFEIPPPPYHQISHARY